MLVSASTVKSASATATPLDTTMVGNIHLDADMIGLAHAFGDLARQFLQQLLEVQGGLVLQLVEDAVHQRQGIDAGLGLHQGVARAGSLTWLAWMESRLITICRLFFTR